MTRAHNSPEQARRMRLPRAPSAVFMMTALLLAAASCGSLAPARPDRDSTQVARQRMAAQPGPLAAGQGGLSVIAASFISVSDGWLLAAPPCAGQVHPCQTLLLRKTTDGGRTWVAVPVSSAPHQSRLRAVSRILFTSSRDGWAWGPELWRTKDGGASWRQVRIGGGPVQGFAAEGGRVLAATGRCGQADPWQCGFQVYGSPAGSLAWRPIPGAGGRQTSPAGLVASGGTGYVFATTADLGRPLLLTGPLSGSDRWRPLQSPCPHAWSMALAAAPGSWLFLGCGSEPGAGQQLKTAFVSGDQGRTWRRAASPPSSGYLGAASMTAGGTILLSGGRMDVYVSRDRGRSWHTSPSLNDAAGQADAGLSLFAWSADDTAAYAIQVGAFQHQVWITRDGGLRWIPVTVR